MTLFGFNVGNGGGEGQSAAQRAADFGTAAWDIARVYGSEYPTPHMLPSTWPSDWILRSPNKQINVCFSQPVGAVNGSTNPSVNRGSYDAMILNFLAIVPADWTVYVSYYHEYNRWIIDGTWTSAEFAAAFLRIGNLIANNQPPSGATVYNVPCINGPWTVAGFSNSQIPLASTMPEGTILQFDCYGNPNGADGLPSGYKHYGTRYHPAAQIVDMIYSAAQARGYTADGYDWAIGEFNAPLRVGTHNVNNPDATGNGTQSPNDISGAQRAQWITDYVNSCLNRAKPPHHILLWSGAGSLWNQNFGTAGASSYPKPPQIVSGQTYTGAWPFTVTRTLPVNAFKAFLQGPSVIQGAANLTVTPGLVADAGGEQEADAELGATPTLVADAQVIQPLFVGFDTDDSAASAGNGTFDLTVPANTLDNDLAILAIGQGGGLAVTLPDGFTHVPDSPLNNASALQTSVAYKTMTQAEAGTVLSGSFGGAQRFGAVLIVLRNARLVLNTSASMQRTLSTTNTSIDLPDVTPTTDNCVLITVASAQSFANGGAYTMTAGANYTERAEAATITSAARNVGVSIATRPITGGAGQSQSGPTLTSSATNRNNTFLLAFDPVFDHFSTAPLHATPSLVATGKATTTGAVDASTVVALVANPDNTANAAAAMPVTASLAAAGVVSRTASAALSAQARLVGAPLNTVVATKSMAVTASLLAAGSITGEAVTVAGSAAVSAAPTLVASPGNTALGEVAISATPTLVGDPSNTANAAAAISVTAGLTADATAERFGDGSFSTTAVLVAEAEVTNIAEATLVATAGLVTLPDGTTEAEASASTEARLSADATVIPAENTSGARIHLGTRRPPRIKRR